MACKRSAVRSCLSPPNVWIDASIVYRLGHRPFTAGRGVRFPLEVPIFYKKQNFAFYGLSSKLPSSRGLGHHPFTVVTGVRIPLGVPITLPALPIAANHTRIIIEISGFFVACSKWWATMVSVESVSMIVSMLWLSHKCTHFRMLKMKTKLTDAAIKGIKPSDKRI